MYAIVDIETTGGNAARNRIIEIAIFIFDGENVIDEFQTLINPERYIPPYISAFTGISNEMVIDAPTFEEVADRLEELMDGKIFVAHNVNFDYSFIKKEFQSIGRTFRNKKLCTVRLGRAIIPGMPSYGLGSFCDELGIPIYHRHRAGGDAAATVKLFAKLVERDHDNFIEYSLKRSSKEALMPPNLDRDKYEDLPEAIGVYFFHDEKGQIVYVGKAKNIKDRVGSHFAGNTNTRTKRMFLNSIHDVSYELCGNELVALLFESHQIKQHWPKFNRSQKRVDFNYGIYSYEDRNGYLRLSVSRMNPVEHALLTFKHLTEARSYLAKKVREFKLCPKLSGLQKAPRECYDYKIEACAGACCGEDDVESYNAKCQQAIDEFGQAGKSFAIVGEGRIEEESSIVLVENGNYLGFGYLHNDIQVDSPEDFKDYINTFPDNPDIQYILEGYLRKNIRDKVLSF